VITRGTAEFYRDAIAGKRPDSWRLAEVLNDVWREADGRLSARGQRVAGTAGGPVLVLWRSSGDRTALLAAFAHAFLDLPSSGVTWQLVDPEGRVIAGAAARSSRSVARIIGNAEYPWTLHVGGASPNAGNAGGNRRLLRAMMAAVLVFVWGATYVMARAIRREAAVARLRSDFVAAVSHEFRSPLTTMRQMAEMLEMNRLPSEERRQQYYGVLAARRRGCSVWSRPC
jgi:signal transduction histidine kinase